MHFVTPELSDTALTELLELNAQWQAALENRQDFFPPASTLETLKAKLRVQLEAQPGVGEVLQAAEAAAQQLCVVHSDPVIRNLPWQTAVADLPLLALAKAHNSDLAEFAPTTGYPLKVLIMVAAPTGATRLDYEREELLLLRAFSPLITEGKVEVHFTEDGSLDNLQEKLEANKYHILHFSGHGIYQDGQGYLALEDPLTGQTDLVKAADFNAVLAGVARKGHAPELIVLSACQSAQGRADDNLAGVANALLQGNTPAVIAMSASILDSCATVFAAALYEKLSQGYPLPAAFQEARKVVRAFEIKAYNPAKSGRAAAQWLIPQLLLSRIVDHLVDKAAPHESLQLKAETAIITGDQALLYLRVRPENYVFIGRRREKRQALQQLQAGHSILLRGQGGVGKTALAEHLAIRMMVGNPRIKVFTLSEQTPTADHLLQEMQQYLTKNHRDFAIVRELTQLDKLTDKFFHLLGKVSAHCDPLFLFDNVESFQHFDRARGLWVWNQQQHEDILTLLQLLDAHTPFPTILTGRYPLAEFPELSRCEMNTAPFSDFFRKCHQLQFSRRYQQKAISSALKRDESAPAASLEDMARLLHATFGGNYRALEFFDELYAQREEGISDTLQQLESLRDSLTEDKIKEGVLAQMGENLVFTQLFACLSERERDSLRVLAQYNIPVFAMAVSTQRAEEDRLPDLQKARELTLLEAQRGTDGRTRYYVTPIVRDLLEENESQQVSFDHQVAGNYHIYVVENDLEENALAEHQEAFEHYYRAGAVDAINTVGWKLCNYYYKLQQFRPAYNYGIRTEAVAGDATSGYIWNNLGLILQMFGQYDQALAYYEKSLADNIKRGDKSGEGTTLNNISQIYDARGDYETALSYLERSLKIRQEIGDKSGEGTTLNNISQIYDARGDYETALSYLERSLKIQQEIGDKSGEGATLNNLATTAHARGDYETALSYLERSLKIQQEIGDKSGEGTTLNNISQIFKARGDYETALSYLERSLKIQQEIGDKSGEGTTLNNISQIFKARGDYETALSYLERSLKIQQEIGDKSGEGTTLNNISQIFKARGDYETALSYLERSLKIQQEIGDKSGEGRTLNNLATTAHARGDYETALSYLERSLKIQQEIGDKSGEGVTLNNMGTIAYEAEDWEKAVAFLLQSYQILERLGSPNKQHPESYLAAIFEKIGKERFQIIVAKLQND